MHQHCFAVFTGQGKPNKKGVEIECPACKQAWPKAPDRGDLKPIGEEAAQDGDDFRRRTRRTPDEDDDEEDEEDEEVDASQQTEEPSQPTQRRQSTRKGKGKATVEDDEDEDD